MIDKLTLTCKIVNLTCFYCFLLMNIQGHSMLKQDQKNVLFYMDIISSFLLTYFLMHHDLRYYPLHMATCTCITAGMFYQVAYGSLGIGAVQGQFQSKHTHADKQLP